MKEEFKAIKSDLDGEKPTIIEAQLAKDEVSTLDLDLPPKDRKSRNTPLIDGLGSILSIGDAVEFIGHPAKFVVLGHDRGEGRILLLTKVDDEKHYFSVQVSQVRKVTK